MSQQAHWSSIKERGSLFGIRFLVAIYKVFGKGLFRICFFPVMLYFYLTGGQARRGVLKYWRNLERSCQQPPCSRLKLHVHGFKVFLTFGVKDATADLSRVCAQRIHCGEDFIQMSGEDATAPGLNAPGGVGCISVTANVAPRLCAELQAATLAGDYGTALKIQDKLMPLHGAIFTEPGLCGAKYGASQLGKCSDEVRLPLTTLSDETKAKMDAGMRYAGLVN